MERTLREVQPGHHFVALSEHLEAGTPIVLSEFGGISYRPAQGMQWFGYETVSDADEYLEKYRELVQAVLDCPTLSGFCYTQLTDTAQETNGLLTAGRTPKLDPAAIREINQGVSQAVPADIITHMRKVTGSPFRGTPQEAGPGDGEQAAEMSEAQP
jgi:hypothetical protein